MTVVVGFLCSLVLTYLVRLMALRLDLVDRPEARRSHSVVTPRGGGAALVPAMVASAGFGIWFTGASALGLWFIPLIGLSGVWLVGLLDDRLDLGMASKLAVHILASGTLLVGLNGQGAGSPWIAGLIGLGSVLWGVSCVNVANFMDGIDGLLGTQALVFGGFAAVILGSSGFDGGTTFLLSLGLVGASGGFLVFNWSPAKIFLGDSGSGSVGFTIALLGMSLVIDASVSLLCALLPLLPIFLDAAATRGRRVLRREGFLGPHRMHLYQRLANRRLGHARTAVLYAGAAAVAAVVAVVCHREGVEWPAGLYVGLLVLLGVSLDRGVGWTP